MKTVFPKPCDLLTFNQWAEYVKSETMKGYRLNENKISSTNHSIHNK